MGKGSTPRPFDIPKDQFRDNWDAIFGKKRQDPPAKPSDKTPAAK